MVQVYCKNTKETKRFPEGTSLLQMLSEFDCHTPFPIVSAKVNNVSQGLKFKVYQNKDTRCISYCTRPPATYCPRASCT